MKKFYPFFPLAAFCGLSWVLFIFAGDFFSSLQLKWLWFSSSKYTTSVLRLMKRLSRQYQKECCLEIINPFNGEVFVTCNQSHEVPVHIKKILLELNDLAKKSFISGWKIKLVIHEDLYSLTKL